ncbi:hypothetical protein [Streptomyces resistomycificus]|uniref:hypothetical protein n=1 Tax=Streptomyces resistomycificus TaxID=67356 RepID=UPI000A70FE37|nr:hypothetical protein [Streptomyces resistomycificus]
MIKHISPKSPSCPFRDRNVGAAFSDVTVMSPPGLRDENGLPLVLGTRMLPL